MLCWFQILKKELHNMSGRWCSFWKAAKCNLFYGIKPCLVLNQLKNESENTSWTEVAPKSKKIMQIKGVSMPWPNWY